MAHEVIYFYAASHEDPTRDIEDMKAGLSQEGQAVEIPDRRSSADWPDAVGTNWVAGWVTADGVASGIHVEVHIRDKITDVTWDEVSRMEGAPGEEKGTGLCIVTLSGELRMDLFERLRGYWKVQREAVEYDEVGGFDVDGRLGSELGR